MESEGAKKNKYYYKAYGLNIESDMEFIELLKLKDHEKDNIHVKIILGEMNEEVKEDLKNNYKYRFKEKDMWFTIQNLAHYHIYNGDTVVIEPLEENKEYKIRAFLLCAAMGMLLIQKNIVAFHGGTVEVNGKSVIIVGNSGAGKSTLTSAFRLNGNKFLADEVSVTTIDENLNIFSVPSFPHQKICEDMAEAFGYDTKKLLAINKEEAKYLVPAHDSYIEYNIPLGAIFEIVVGDEKEKEVLMEEVLGQEKLFTFLQHTYRKGVRKYTGTDKEYFTKCINMIKNIPVYIIRRPANKITVNEQMELIKKALAEKYDDKNNKLAL